MAAEKVALPLTKDANKSGTTDWEYGGWIVKTKDGKYTYTEPMRGAERGKTDIDNMIVPDGFRKVAWYHTHPDNGSWGEGFSGWDMAIADDKRLRGYVGMTWSGNVRKYDPGITKRNGYGVSGDLVGHIDF